MFSLLRKIYYRNRKEGNMRHSIITNNDNKSPDILKTIKTKDNKKCKSSYYGQKTKDNLDIDKSNYSKKGLLLLDSFRILFGFLIKDFPEDVVLTGLNYIYRFMEDPIYYEIESKFNTVK